MGWASRPNPEFMPSAKSVALGASAGVEAGGMFMLRALYDMEPFIHQRLVRAVDTYITTQLDN